MKLPSDLHDLLDQLAAADRGSDALVARLDERTGTARPAEGAWSVAECLDHLATTNRVYLAALHDGAKVARQRGRLRRGPARPGLLGRWFARMQEPPVRARMRTLRSIQPRPSPTLGDALTAFRASQDALRRFVAENADLDLAGARFRNPLAGGLPVFSLASGLHIMAAHERRHLWQAGRVWRGSDGSARFLVHDLLTGVSGYVRDGVALYLGTLHWRLYKRPAETRIYTCHSWRTSAGATRPRELRWNDEDVEGETQLGSFSWIVEKDLVAQVEAELARGEAVRIFTFDADSDLCIEEVLVPLAAA
jgi:hypothetical protein